MRIAVLILIKASIIAALCVQNVAWPFKGPYHFKVTKHEETAQRNDAARLWEQAIAAKGGRERLHAVRNMVISTRGEYHSRLLKRNQIRREELLVFPNRYWFWDDYRPDVLGLRVSMYNYDSNMKYAISEGEPNQAPEPIAKGKRNKALRNDQLSFLLETQWLKPTLIKARTGTVGQRHVDIVETTIEGERVDFAFDQSTHLPLSVSYYDIVNGKAYINVQSFSDYMEVDGIQLPRIIRFGDGSKYEASFQINVEYDETIFVNPPPIDAGPEAWRLKGI